VLVLIIWVHKKGPQPAGIRSLVASLCRDDNERCPSNHPAVTRTIRLSFELPLLSFELPLLSFELPLLSFELPLLSSRTHV